MQSIEITQINQTITNNFLNFPKIFKLIIQPISMKFIIIYNFHNSLLKRVNFNTRHTTYKSIQQFIPQLEKSSTFKHHRSLSKQGNHVHLLILFHFIIFLQHFHINVPKFPS
jgi:hypothetical protein